MMRVIFLPIWIFHIFLFPVLLLIVMGWIGATIKRKNYHGFRIARGWLITVLLIELMIVLSEYFHVFDLDLYRGSRSVTISIAKETAFSICLIMGLSFLEKSVFELCPSEPEDPASTTESSVLSSSDPISFIQPSSGNSQGGQSSAQVLENAMKQVEEAVSAVDPKQLSEKNSELNPQSENNGDQFDFRTWVVEDSQKK